MDKKLFKLLSFVLAIIVTIMSLPMAAFASAIQQSDDIVSPNETLNSNSGIFEVVELRTATTKHFRLEDGSYYVAQYETDIHYEDESGKWQNIDNTLSATGSEISTSNAKIKFAKKTNGNAELFALHDGNRKISLSLDNASKGVEGKITNNESNLGEDATELQKMTTLDKISASVKYEDILSETDIEYVIDGLNIKENIIVKSRQNAYSYSFTMSLNNLTASLNDDGKIIISDSKTGESVYLIPAPVMWDAEGVASDNVNYSLTSLENGKYNLTVNADSEWMNAEERVYPVIIDPPINTYDEASYITDLNVSSANASYNSSASASLLLSNDYKVYWKINYLPTLPNSAYIIDAKFNMKYAENTSPNGYIGLYDVLSNWSDTLTWNDVISTTAPEGQPASTYTDYVKATYSSMVNGINTGFSWNVTPIVKKWYAGQNYGLMLKAVDGMSFSGTVAFLSNESTVASKRPCITIQYRDMKGLEDYWSFTSQSAGYAGSGAVNNATGNLVFSIPTLTSTDALMPVTPTLVYNSALSATTYSFPNVQSAYETEFTPYGFKLNLSETLIKKTFTNNNAQTDNFYIWTDSDGTEHYFMPTASASTYIDEDGLLLTLNVGTEECTVTDSDKNVKTFLPCYAPAEVSDAWYLSSITDKVGNKVVFEVDSYYRPVAVKLYPYSIVNGIEQLRISYTSTGKIYAVWNPTSEEGIIFRYSPTPEDEIQIGNEAYLRQVVRARGGNSYDHWDEFYNANYNGEVYIMSTNAVADYSYDISGRLIAVTNNMSQYRIEYGYDASGRVISVKEYASANNLLGQQLSIEYGTYSSFIRTSGSDDVFNTSDDLVTTYGFDEDGRTVNCYTTDLDRTQVYGATYGKYVGEDNSNAKNNLKSSVQSAQRSSNYILNGGFEDVSALTIQHWTTSGLVANNYTNAYEGQTHLALTVNATNPVSSISQNVYLDEGEYSLSIQIDSYNAKDVNILLKAESVDNPSYSVTKEIPVNIKNVGAISYAPTGRYDFAGLKFSSNPEIEGGEEQFRITLTVSGTPTSDVTVTVDNIMLGDAIGETEFDMVKMGHFENSHTSYTPDDFWGESSASEDDISVIDSGDTLFGNVLKVEGELETSIPTSQVVYTASDSLIQKYNSGTYSESDTTFTLSAWGKTDLPSYTTNGTFGMIVHVRYHDGTSNPAIESFDLDFDRGITDWQFASTSFSSDSTKGMIKSIELVLVYGDNPGDGYFDSVSLIKNSSSANLYTYTDSGYIKKVQNAKVVNDYYYDANNNVTRIVSTNGIVQTYTYNEYGLVTYEKRLSYGSDIDFDSDVALSELEELTSRIYQYNSYGLLISEFYGDNNGDGMTITTYWYNTAVDSHIFGTVYCVEDALEGETKYFYDENNGRLLAMTYPEGNGASYQYDAIGNLTMVYPANITPTNVDYTVNTSSASVSYTYDSVTKRLETITTKPSSSTSTTYSFEYDVFGNTTEIGVGTRTLAGYTYNANNGKLNTLSYGNGLQVKYLYDALDRVSEIQYNGGEGGAFVTVYKYGYDAYGNLSSVTDLRNNEITLYQYDGSGKLVDSYVYDSQSLAVQSGTAIYYDDQQRLSEVFHNFGYTNSSATDYGEYINYSYFYSSTTGKLANLGIGGSGGIVGNVSPTYDNLHRLKTRYLHFYFGLNSILHTQELDYVVVDGEFYEANLVSQVINKTYLGDLDGTLKATFVYNYTYDANGNITQITDANGNILHKYYYDDLDQIIREDSSLVGSTYTYAYDNAGNIISKNQYEYTTTDELGESYNSSTYTYGDASWKDLLTNYSTGWSMGSITYDNVGNPIQMGDMTLTWEGRQLKHIAYSHGPTVSYEYNADGIRTAKEICTFGPTNVQRHEYTVSGSQILAERVSVNGTDQYLLIYMYDENGAPIGLKYKDLTSTTKSTYLFGKNAQGDVCEIYNESGNLIGRYHYSAYGEIVISDHSWGTLDYNVLFNYNPFRYRGYYYDSDTRWYYLQSRYYNPEICRFINADKYINANGDIIGYNQFAYCSNNPIRFVDFSGTVIVEVILLTALLGGVAITLTSSQDEAPYYRQQAHERYNESNVAVYEKDFPPIEKKEVNAEIYYPSEDKINISIDRSLNITSKYEQEAILDVIINSPYYSEEVFGSRSFMRAQWMVHNICYDIASSGDFGYFVAQQLSGSYDPIQSSQSLDIRSKNNLLKRQRILYTIVAFFS